MIEKIVFTLWLCVIVLGVYFLIKILKLNAKLDNDIKELEKADEMFKLDLENFEKMTFILIPDDQGTIFDKDNNRYRLEKRND